MNFHNAHGGFIIDALCTTLIANRDMLSELDRLAGDGDHGINMAKGFKYVERNLKNKHVSMSEGFQEIGTVLEDKIGGSMGPLYGRIFKTMAEESIHESVIDEVVYVRMIDQAVESLKTITEARRNDKTLMDVLLPVQDYLLSVNDVPFNTILEQTTHIAEQAAIDTKKIAAKYGRSSRLGDASIGIQDAGATSCALIIKTMNNAMMRLIKEDA